MTQEGENASFHPISEAEDIGPYRLTAPTEIGFVLRSLAQRGDFVSISFNSGREMLLTRILDVDLKAREFVFDLSGHEQSNLALTKTEKAIFMAAPEGVRVQFVTRHVRRVSHEGQPAFAAPFPADLIKLQRRDYFRLQTPISSPYLCRLAVPGCEPLRLEVHDVSLGGVGIWCPENRIDKLEVGLKLAQVTFDFGPGGVMRIDVEVRNRRPIVNRQGQTQYLIGLLFCNLARTQEAALQRLISQLERERKALLG